MGRDIDDRKKRKALRQLRKAAELAERGDGQPLSTWEETFLQEVEERIEAYGSAFADPDKGALEEPLSAMQRQKLKEIDKKARGKSTGFKPGKPLGGKSSPPTGPRVRDINDDVDDVAHAEPIEAPETAPDRPSGRPALRIIKGGLDD